MTPNDCPRVPEKRLQRTDAVGYNQKQAGRALQLTVGVRQTEGEDIRPTVLIWIDWIAAAVAGVVVLSLRGWLADLYSLPKELLLVIGVTNLAYGSVSFTLAMSSRGGRVPLLRGVAAANVAWAVCCAVLAAAWVGTASTFGLVQLIGEGILVGALGVLEWRAGTPRAATGFDPSSLMGEQAESDDAAGGEA